MKVVQDWKNHIKKDIEDEEGQINDDEYDELQQKEDDAVKYVGPTVMRTEFPQIESTRFQYDRICEAAFGAHLQSYNQAIHHGLNDICKGMADQRIEVMAIDPSKLALSSSSSSRKGTAKPRRGKPGKKPNSKYSGIPIDQLPLVSSIKILEWCKLVSSTTSSKQEKKEAQASLDALEFTFLSFEDYAAILAMNQDNPQPLLFIYVNISNPVVGYPEFTPYECMMNKSSYEAPIHVTIQASVHLQVSDTESYVVRARCCASPESLKPVLIGNCPIMINSDRCLMRNKENGSPLPAQTQREASWDPNHMGRIFIGPGGKDFSWMKPK